MNATRATVLGVTIALATLCPSGAGADADADRPLRVAPGRVAFVMTASGRWKSFGLRIDRPLVKDGGVLVFSTDADGELVLRASAASGDTRSLTAQAIPATHEGARGGERAPSSFPDDDRDGRVDEDPLDAVDNDQDGSVDEDFAAVGDEMTVACFSPRDERTLVIRQECYGWSLPHIDGMVASAVAVRNEGRESIHGVRVGVQLETDDRLAFEQVPRIESARWTGEGTGDLSAQPVLLRTGGRLMALLLFAPRTMPSVSWDVHEDRSQLVVTSPPLGDLAPGMETLVYTVLVALPDDDLKMARALHAAVRTVVGDRSARLIPPPVPITAAEVSAVRSASTSASGIDAFWNTPGRLLETLVVGSPNPFRDAITIDYEVPERVIDEDGVEHVLSAVSVATSVKVYNVAGRLVATLVDTEHAPGRYRTGWTAHNDTGESVASGVYYVKLTIGKRSVTHRLVQLK